ncbi:MAG: NAD(P)H-dependent oxidoreductase subunit E [Colwellia sp.]|nr:NAD(P)H-dependent oxidoreductase subunit E [Colwellia sp.]
MPEAKQTLTLEFLARVNQKSELGADINASAKQVIDIFAGDASCCLQMVILLQQRFGYVPEQAKQQITKTLDLPISHIDGLISFYAFLKDKAFGKFSLFLSDNITDRMLGSQDVAAKFCQKLNVSQRTTRTDGKVYLGYTSCTGLCDQGPAMIVNGFAINNLTDVRITQISDLIEKNVDLADWPEELFSIDTNIHQADHLLSSKPFNGEALAKLSQQPVQDIMQELQESKLRGRGGAGFNTYRKWLICQQTESENRVVVCNADEGEPGTFKDRILLQDHADTLVEGMTLCARLINADHGFIYLRAEYLFLYQPLVEMLARRRQQNLLGANINGIDGFNFDVDIHLGAGAYVCGEESALIESLEGKRGIPRIRPPYPVTSGYHGLPTVVNNVETYIAASHIVLNGGDWFAEQGVSNSAGTKLHSVSGDCKHPGIYELPLGATIRYLLAQCGGENAQAVQVGGASGTLVPAKDFDRGLEFDDIPTGGSFMVFSKERDIFDIIKNFAEFFRHESCGFCTPCRVGTSLSNDILGKIANGQGMPHDIDRLQRLNVISTEMSQCGLGQTAHHALGNALTYFPESFTKRLQSKENALALDLEHEIVRITLNKETR